MKPQTAYKQLNLSHLQAALPRLLETARQEQWTSETMVERALCAELDGREQKANARRLKAARIPSKKTWEGFDFPFQPSLSQRRLRELGDLSFVRTCTTVVFLGPPGTGKTHVSLALADRALSAGHAVLFTTLAELAQSVESASHPGLMRQRLPRSIAPSLLVRDEVGDTRLTAEQAHHFFALVAARSEHGSIILTSQTSFPGWGAFLGDEVLATALLDRLLHHAEVIAIHGPRSRMKERQATSASPDVALTSAGGTSIGVRSSAFRSSALGHTGSGAVWSAFSSPTFSEIRSLAFVSSGRPVFNRLGISAHETFW